VIQNGERTAHDQYEKDDHNDAQAVFAPQDLQRSREPAPDRVTRLFDIAERIRVDQFAPLSHIGFISPGRQRARQDSRADHQNQQESSHENPYK